MPCVRVQAIGIAEILGALGLVLPGITGIYSRLTPAAALALALLMLLASVFHLLQRETTEASINVLLFIMLAFVVHARWLLML